MSQPAAEPSSEARAAARFGDLRGAAGASAASAAADSSGGGAGVQSGGGGDRGMYFPMGGGGGAPRADAAAAARSYSNGSGGRRRSSSPPRAGRSKSPARRNEPARSPPRGRPSPRRAHARSRSRSRSRGRRHGSRSRERERSAKQRGSPPRGTDSAGSRRPPPQAPPQQQQQQQQAHPPSSWVGVASARGGAGASDPSSVRNALATSRMLGAIAGRGPMVPPEPAGPAAPPMAAAPHVPALAAADATVVVSLEARAVAARPAARTACAAADSAGLTSPVVSATGAVAAAGAGPGARDSAIVPAGAAAVDAAPLRGAAYVLPTPPIVAAARMDVSTWRIGCAGIVTTVVASNCSGVALEIPTGVMTVSFQACRQCAVRGVRAQLKSGIIGRCVRLLADHRICAVENCVGERGACTRFWPVQRGHLCPPAIRQRVIVQRNGAEHRCTREDGRARRTRARAHASYAACVVRRRSRDGTQMYIFGEERALLPRVTIPAGCSHVAVAIARRTEPDAGATTQPLAASGVPVARAAASVADGGARPFVVIAPPIVTSWPAAGHSVVAPRPSIAASAARAPSAAEAHVAVAAMRGAPAGAGGADAVSSVGAAGPGAGSAPVDPPVTPNRRGGSDHAVGSRGSPAPPPASTPSPRPGGGGARAWLRCVLFAWVYICVPVYEELRACVYECVCVCVCVCVWSRPLMCMRAARAGGIAVGAPRVSDTAVCAVCHHAREESMFSMTQVLYDAAARAWGVRVR